MAAAAGLQSLFFRDQKVFLHSVVEIGRPHAIVFEQPDAIKSYLVRWRGVKIDLTKLAKLRWIENMKTPELCGVFGKRRSAIRQHIRTLRKCGISHLNLSPDEQKLILLQMNCENKIYGGKDHE